MASYLYSELSGSWFTIGVTDAGGAVLEPVSFGIATANYINDWATNTTSWLIQVWNDGVSNRIQRVSESYDAAYPTEIVLQSPLGYSWALQVNTNGQMSQVPAPAYPTLPVLVPIDGTTATGGIIGMVSASRRPPINVVEIGMDSSKDSVNDNRGSKQFTRTWRRWDFNSITSFRQMESVRIDSQGLVSFRGGMFRLALLADRILKRHAWCTPEYKFRAGSPFLAMRIGDFFSLTCPTLRDYVTGARGVTSVVCEIVDAKPDYRDGTSDFTVWDTRFMQTCQGAWIAPSSFETWSDAAGQAGYMFISNNAQPPALTDPDAAAPLIY